jgi:NADPH-dependent 2,4-dienoyl-CoA reductase/sulfur reductase-like enzyme
MKIIIIKSKKAGPAGFACAQTLREFNFSGFIVMVTKDNHLPYDKTKLTKRIKDTQPEDFYLR